MLEDPVVPLHDVAVEVFRISENLIVLGLDIYLVAVVLAGPNPIVADNEITTCGLRNVSLGYVICKARYELQYMSDPSTALEVDRVATIEPTCTSGP